MNTTATRKYEIATGLVILGLSFGLFLFAEAGLRAVQLIKFGQTDSVEKSSAYFIEQSTGLRLNHPNRTLGRVKINNVGFRGPDVVIPKPEKTLRLAFLGSSTTYNAGVAEGENWPHLVAKLVGEQTPRCAVDFVNAGKPGYSLGGMTKIYRHHVTQTDPDLVFVLAGDANKDLDTMARAKGFETDHQTYQSVLNKYSILLQKVEKNVRVIQLQRAASYRTGKLEIEFENLGNEFREQLIALVEAIKANNQEPVLITKSTQLRKEQSEKEQIQAANTMLYYMPYIYLPDMVGVTDRYNSIIREVGEAMDVVVIGNEFSIPGTDEYFVDSAHFSAAGSKVMATRVVEQLSASRLAPASLFEKYCKASG